MRKKKSSILVITVLLAFSMLLPTPSFAQSNTRLPVSVYNPFSEGLAVYADIINKELLYGYVNTKGEVVIPARLIRATPFSEGLAAVNKDGAYGYINTFGKFVLKLNYDFAQSFHEGFAAVTYNGYTSYIDKNGNELVRLELEDPLDAKEFSNGLAAVKKDARWGFYNTNGKLTIPHQYINTHGFKEELAAVQLPNNNWTFITKEGKRPFAKEYEQALSFTEGLAPVKVKDKWGFLNKKGELAISAKFDEAYPFSEGTAAVKDGKKWGYVDKFGNYIIPPVYESVDHGFKEGIALVYRNQSPVYIGKRGQVVLSSKDYNYGGSFSEGFVSLSYKNSMDFSIIPNPLFQPPSLWANTEVSNSISLSLVPKDMQHSYTATISRQEFSRLMVELAKASGVALPTKIEKNPFTDTDDQSVLIAYQLGFINGRGSGFFDPHGSITRQEATLMLKNVGTKIGIPGGKGLAFTDQNQIATWAQDGVSYVSSVQDKASSYPVMATTGDNKFSPTGNYTREQAYITVKRLFNAR